MADFVLRDDGERQRSAEKAHKKEKAEQIMVANKECRSGHQLCVTTANNTPREKQKYGRGRRGSPDRPSRR